MAEDEDDYMSDKFINPGLENNVRPGLLHSNKQRRELEQFKKKQESSRSFKDIAEERRTTGLKTAIPETNKGFEMLKKMGYKPGSGVGKSEDGPCNPLSIQLKENKFGLGLSTQLNDKQKLMKQTTFSAYRSAMKKRKDFSTNKYDYGRIRRACQHFDEKDDITSPIKSWFWPDDVNVEEQNNSDENSETSDSDSEEEKKPKALSATDLEWRIEQIATYLREKYNYCMWCGFRYDDEKDLLKDCPGRTRISHEESTQKVIESE